ncbi:hypothetical protein HP499_11065 [Paenarthrobacter sp. CM16]|uniref:hypothetical protein n=1 Tax=Paenarthrobacter sp. CM16 TaxID=2738447 RepID=UPI00155554D8|nr:hypothetical protein [Paenarthrobacter sp. CM16]NQD88344.1 hypothetical protein [Paenarthrobacter sp. CM16]
MANTAAPVSINQHQDTADIEFHVTYLDTETGRVRREDLHDLAAAERFASAQLRDEHGWAVVDHVTVQQSSRMVA